MPGLSYDAAIPLLALLLAVAGGVASGLVRIWHAPHDVQLELAARRIEVLEQQLLAAREALVEAGTRIQALEHEIHPDAHEPRPLP